MLSTIKDDTLFWGTLPFFIAITQIELFKPITIVLFVGLSFVMLSSIAKSFIYRFNSVLMNIDINSVENTIKQMTPMYSSLLFLIYLSTQNLTTLLFLVSFFSIMLIKELKTYNHTI